MSKRLQGDKGAAMVEFAIVLPVLLLILLGIIEFGRAWNAQESIQAAAREGARELAVNPGDDVKSVVVSRAVGVGLTTADVNQSGCTAPGGTPATITVTKDFSFMALPFGPIELEATGVMRCGL
jgi:Flp pilus assembly protein TadG